MDVSVGEAHRAWAAGELAIIDCREEDEHDATRIEGVPLIPMSEFLARVDELPGDRPLAIICRSGSRSGRVADYLTAGGEHGERRLGGDLVEPRHELAHRDEGDPLDPGGRVLVVLAHVDDRELPRRPGAVRLADGHVHAQKLLTSR